jgi:glycosyltransferase involved in cell wall biosynthesis
LEQLSPDDTRQLAGPKIRLIGPIWPQAKSELEQSKVSHYFIHVPPVPHSDAIEIMQAADVLLLLMSDNGHWSDIMPAKVFEYLRSGTPVLAIAPDGPASRVIIETGVGCVVRPNDILQLCKILKLIAADMSEFRKRYFCPQAEIIRRFERRSLTRELVKVLDSILDSGQV